MAVDLFRSPRSKGGFGEVADWADFPDSSVRHSFNPRPGLPRYLAAIRVHMSLTEGAMSIWAPLHNQNAVAEVAHAPFGDSAMCTRLCRGHQSAQPQQQARLLEQRAMLRLPRSARRPCEVRTTTSSKPELLSMLCNQLAVPEAHTRTQHDAAFVGRSSDNTTVWFPAVGSFTRGPRSATSPTAGAGGGARASPGSPRPGGSSPRSGSGSPCAGSPSSPLLSAPMPIAAPAVMPPEGSVGPPSPAARGHSPSAMLALPFAASSPPGSPSHLAAPSLLQRSAGPRSGSPLAGLAADAAPTGDVAGSGAAVGETAGANGSVAGGSSAAAMHLPPAVLPRSQLAASLSAAAAVEAAAAVAEGGTGGAAGPIVAVPAQPMAVGGPSDPPRPPQPGAGSGGGAASGSPAAAEGPSAAQPASSGGSEAAAAEACGGEGVSGAAGFANWADFGGASAKHTLQGQPTAEAAAPPPASATAGQQQQQGDEDEERPASPFKRTGSLRAHNFWQYDPASETDSDRED